MANKLTVINHNGIEVVDSREVAAVIGKEHKHLIRDIRGYINIMANATEPKIGLSENTDSTAPKIKPSDFFIPSSYKDSTGRTLPCYLLTKKGCDMVANKLTGEKGVLFTATYVTAFEQKHKLVFLNKKKIPFTTSEIIAEGTNNQHKNVKELIRKYENDMKSFGTLDVLNGESTGGRPKEVFLLNEEQAAFLMTLLRNSQVVVAFKKELIRQFYAMREYIYEHNSPQWQQKRAESKSNRRMETDTIKDFVAYAIAQGSTHADQYYTLYSKLANNTVGLPSGQRDNASIFQLNNLTVVEAMLASIIKACMAKGMSYKDIYQICKTRLEAYKNFMMEDPTLTPIPAQKPKKSRKKKG